MKKLLIVSAIAVLGATGAQAADLPARTYTKATVYAAPAYNWTGFYVGAHVGGVFRGSDNFFIGGNPATQTSTGNDAWFIGGGQVGADYQFAPNWLIGIEGQFSGMSDNMRTYANGINGIVTTKTEWLASLTGRLGYTWGPGLLYAKGGVAFRDNGNIQEFFSDPTFTTNHRDTGYTVGGGLEYMFVPAWSAKIEYQYYDFGTTNVSTPTGVFSLGGVNYKENLHTVKAGINYHFNWGGPVVANY